MDDLLGTLDKQSDERGDSVANRLVDSAEQVTQSARDYFASEFPNPHREWCPSRVHLRSIARSGGLPADELRAHLFTCSECFGEYREALVLDADPAVHSAGRSVVAAFRARPVLAIAAMIVVATLSVAIVIALRKGAGGPPPPTIADRDDSDGSASRDNPGAGSKPSEQQVASIAGDRSITNKNSSRQLASNYREIDLDDYVRQRGGGAQRNSPITSIQLSASLNRLLFRLPEARPRGAYRVTISSPRMERTVAAADARSFDGRTLKVTLDLRKLDAGRYVLCVSPEREAPFCYEIVVTQ